MAGFFRPGFSHRPLVLIYKKTYYLKTWRKEWINWWYKNYIGYLSTFLLKNVLPTDVAETPWKLGIIDRSLLFNINICDLFLFIAEEAVTSYPDDTNLAYNSNLKCRTI